MYGTEKQPVLAVANDGRGHFYGWLAMLVACLGNSFKCFIFVKYMGIFFLVCKLPQEHTDGLGDVVAILKQHLKQTLTGTHRYAKRPR